MKFSLITKIGSLVLLASMAACTKFLDIQPVGNLIPSKVEDLENLLNSTNTLSYHFIDNNNGSFYAFLGDNYRISPLQAEYFYTSTNPNIERYAAYTFYRPYSNPNLLEFTWDRGIYKAVGIFNNVISGIADLGEQDSEHGRQVIAQAKAGRAWSYLVGALGYGPMYDPSGANDSKVIPYVTSPEPLAAVPQLSTTAELMAYVEQDLEDALAAPSAVSNPSRAGLSAVYGLKALVAMYKRDWSAMYQHADEGWRRAEAQAGGVDNLIYDYNDFSYAYLPGGTEPTDGTDIEVNLNLVGPDQQLEQSYHRENLFYRIAPTVLNIYPSADFLANFDPETDRRYQLFALNGLGYATTVGAQSISDGVVRQYYKGNKMNINQGLTFPELLLMRAEAAARLNNLSQALADLNLLRRYRYAGATTDLPDSAALSQDELLMEILNERRRELPIGSFQRTFDLKRFALDVGKPWGKTSVEHRIGEQLFSAPIDNSYYTLPLSNIIIRFNPQWGLPLNEGAYTPKN